eukprot:3678099-Prymnesium_polylepis.2
MLPTWLPPLPLLLLRLRYYAELRSSRPVMRLGELVSNLPVGRDRERALSATTREGVRCGGCESNPRAKSCRRRA